MFVMVVFFASAAATALPPSGPSWLFQRLQKEEGRKERVGSVSALVILNNVRFVYQRRDENCAFNERQVLAGG